VRPLRSLSCGGRRDGAGGGDSVKTLPQSSLPQSQPGDGGELIARVAEAAGPPRRRFYLRTQGSGELRPRLSALAWRQMFLAMQGEGDRGSPSPASSLALRGRRRVRQQSRR
jgi:hypothetical protein